jgi:hypothetical protein
MEQDNPRLSLRVGGKSVGAHLDAAIERGDVLRRDDGSLSLGRAASDRRDAVRRKGGFIGRAGANERFCGFLNGFLFNQAYDAAQVPAACRSCFKVKISTRSLRALMAAKEIAEATDYTTKSGSQVDDPTNSDIYGTYVYVDGLEEARATHRRLREAVDAHDHLGPAVTMTIKRGCTNYERACGPSDQYAFGPGLEAVETYLATRFRDETAPRMVPKEAVASLRMLQLIRTAYRIGDETYKDFTDGKALFAPLVSYSLAPEPSSDPASPADG